MGDKQKAGVIALIAAGVVGIVAVGVKMTQSFKQKREQSKEFRNLKRLEEEQFNDLD